MYIRTIILEMGKYGIIYTMLMNDVVLSGSGKYAQSITAISLYTNKGLGSGRSHTSLVLLLITA